MNEGDSLYKLCAKGEGINESGCTVKDVLRESGIMFEVVVGWLGSITITVFVTGIRSTSISSSGVHTYRLRTPIYFVFHNMIGNINPEV